MANEKGKLEGTQQSTQQGSPPAKQNIGPSAGEPKPGPRGEGKAEEATQAGLEQIREILFGAVHRELDRRLVRADAHLAARAQDLEQETRRRTEVLETHLKRETEALAARLEREFAETGDTLRKLAREQREAISSVEQKLAKIEESSVQGRRELRNQLLEQAKSFLDELQRLRKELFTTLQRELSLAEGELAEELRETQGQPSH
jgi:hypothetical protein